MSRILTFALFSTLLILTSCGGGWSDEQKAQIKNKCIADGGFDCDCVVESVVKAHANPDGYNKLSDEDKNDLMKDCVVEVEEEAEEEIESF
ncbi:MAG: hypothetical protein ACO2Z9_03505 [Crocinitomicaceae bacterium]